MTENKLTDNEIIKALECCINSNCGECPMIDTDNCDLDKLTLDLIKRKEEQIESLISGQETLQKFIAKKNAEIDMLNQNIEVLAICKKDLPQITMNAIKSEAVKEFAERFLKKIYENHYLLSDKHNSTSKGMFTIGIEQAVKETEKEMVGEG